MQIELKTQPNSRVELTITVPAERMVEFVDSAYQALANQVEIAGFRKGKAPRAIVIERVGEDRLMHEALDLAVPRTYHEAVVEKDLTPIAEPSVHVEESGLDKPLVYRVEVDVLPQVETGNYSTVKVNAKKYEAKKVEQKAIDEAVERVQKAFAKPKVVLRAAKTGDFVEMSYTGKDNGVVQESLQSHKHPLVIGDGSILPEFDSQLVGMSAGEEKTFTIDVPVGGESDAKKPIDFTVKLDQVSELELPELDDELAKKVGKKTGAEVLEEIEKGLQDELNAEARIGLETAVIEEVVKKAKLELPESLIEREVAARLESLGEQLERSGQTLKQFLGHQKKTLEEFHQEMRPAAEQAVRTGLVLRAIAENEGLVDTKKDEANAEILHKVVDFLVESATK